MNRLTERVSEEAGKEKDEYPLLKVRAHQVVSFHQYLRVGAKADGEHSAEPVAGKVSQFHVRLEHQQSD